jgi:hypothetical protein
MDVREAQNQDARVRRYKYERTLAKVAEKEIEEI